MVVTGYAGQVSLAQLALAGAGGYTLSFLTISWGVPFPMAPILAALFATVIGVVVGLPGPAIAGPHAGRGDPGLRLRHRGGVVPQHPDRRPRGAPVEAPTLFGMELGPGIGKAFPRVSFGLVCLITLVLVGARASPSCAAARSARPCSRCGPTSGRPSGLGVNVTRVKVLAFAIASFIAGLGGCLLAYSRGTITFDSFLAVVGLVLLSTAYLAGVTSVWGGDPGRHHGVGRHRVRRRRPVGRPR